MNGKGGPAEPRSTSSSGRGRLRSPGHAGDPPGDRRSIDHAGRGRRRGRRQGAGQVGGDRRADLRGQAVHHSQRLRAGLHQEQPGPDEALRAEYEAHQGHAHRQRVQGAPHPGREGSRNHDIIARLKKDPGAFETGRERSKDDGSKKGNGGDLGWFDLAGMVPEFGAAVSKLEKGKITDEPVKTQFGYHVIQLEDSKPIEAPPFDEVKPNLAPQVQQQALKKHLDDLKAKARIEIVAAPAPAAK
ncbi:MAG: peptidylprolyl isomerase [Betaproteobacteria bacterium]|nr:peptidylprolyl isomerase [Betaproteobacteria bacterium]